jgi:hypothetical protein
VFFQPKISSLWIPKNWLLKNIWDITSVSIAAQIGTLPLTLFYFNRFPPWFIIGNLVVIPLVTIITIVFIIMLIFLVVPLVFSLILKVLLFLIGIMNMSVNLIDKLPSPDMDKIFLSNFQMFCFVMILIAITFFIRYKINNFLFVGLASLLFLIFAGSLRKYQSMYRSEMVLFSVPGKMIMGLFEGTDGVFIHNAADTTDISGSLAFKCKPYIIRNGISGSEIAGLSDSLDQKFGFRKIPGERNYFFRFGNKSVLILNDPVFFSGMQSIIPLNSDIVIVNNRIPRMRTGQKPLFFGNHLLISTAASRYNQFKAGETGIIQSDSIYDTRISGVYKYSEKGNGH